MDNVEDQDEPDAWWATVGPGAAISAATGLYFSACLALNQLDELLQSQETAQTVRKVVLSRFLEMCSGQHLDIHRERPSLEEYWEIAQAKSGIFFSLACWGGARLASERESVLQGFHRFGLHTGLIVQIMDDLDELNHLEDPQKARSFPRSLPAVYVRAVCEPPIREKFESLTRSAHHIQAAREEIYEIIEANGGVLYLLTEIEKHRKLALQGLELAEARQPARDSLSALLEQFSPS